MINIKTFFDSPEQGETLKKKESPMQLTKTRIQAMVTVR